MYKYLNIHMYEYNHRHNTGQLEDYAFKRSKSITTLTLTTLLIKSPLIFCMYGQNQDALQVSWKTSPYESFVLTGTQTHA